VLYSENYRVFGLAFAGRVIVTFTWNSYVIRSAAVYIANECILRVVEREPVVVLLHLT
jgi:hypothetical protein